MDSTNRKVAEPNNKETTENDEEEIPFNRYKS